MSKKLTDAETGEAVSLRELARRRVSRAEQRQSPQPQASSDLGHRSEWDPLLARRMEREKRPPSGLPPPAVVQPQRPAPLPQKPINNLGLTAEQIPDAHRRGDVDFDRHPGRDMGPGFRYSVSAGQGFINDKTMRGYRSSDN